MKAQEDMIELQGARGDKVRENLKRVGL